VFRMAITFTIDRPGAPQQTIIQQAARRAGMYCGASHKSVVQDMRD
jgi:hypothetical protein